MYSSGMFFKKSVCEKKINEEIDHITFNYSFHKNIQIWNQNESLTVNKTCVHNCYVNTIHNQLYAPNTCE